MEVSATKIHRASNVANTFRLQDPSIQSRSSRCTPLGNVCSPNDSLYLNEPQTNKSIVSVVAPQRRSKCFITACSMLTNLASYFTPHHLHGVGTFQDGGLTFNNPASIAVRETAALFPAAPKPSIVVSLGTGFACTEAPPERTGWHQVWEESFPSRLFRAFWKHGDSNVAWKHLLTQPMSQAKEKYFRFDVQFESAPPALDDVAGMSTIARIARESTAQCPAMERLAKSIRAELFVFELDCKPRRLRNGVYLCTGHIYCRLQAGTTENIAFMEQLTQSAAFFQYQAKRLPISFASSSCKATQFCQKITFRVPRRHDEFHITLQEGSSLTCDISGSPFTLDCLMQQQKLDSRSFGGADHQHVGY